MDAIAHAAVLEAATLLDGRVPGSAGEERYVVERVDALPDAVADAVDAAPVDDELRPARTEARLEVGRIAGGSAVQDATTLARRATRDDLSADRVAVAEPRRARRR